MAFVTNISESYNKHNILYAGHVYVSEMQLAPGEEIGMELHKVEQITYIIQGEGVASFPDTAELEPVEAGSVVVIPEQTHHNITNTGRVRMKLLTVYSGDPHPSKKGFAKRVQDEAPELYDSVVDIMELLPSFSRTTQDPWQQLYMEYVSLRRSLALNWSDVVAFAEGGDRRLSVTADRLRRFEQNYPLLAFLYARDSAVFAEALRETGESRVDQVAADLGLQSMFRRD